MAAHNVHSVYIYIYIYIYIYMMYYHIYIYIYIYTNHIYIYIYIYIYIHGEFSKFPDFLVQALKIESFHNFLNYGLSILFRVVELYFSCLSLEILREWDWNALFIRGALNNFPDFFCTGI